MTLSRYFTDSRTLVGNYLWQRTQPATPLLRAANRALAETLTLRPAGDAHYPWGGVAYAVPHILRACFPEYAPNRTAAYRGALALTQMADTPYSAAFMANFFAYAAEVLRDATKSPEIRARLTYALGLLEEAWRSPHFLLGPLFTPDPKRSVAELLAIPDDTIVADLVAIHDRFLTVMGEKLALPHALYPSFGRARDNGSDPLVLGDELLLIKTTTQPKLDATWLREALGWLLLDMQDQARIGHIGFYCARQGTHISWPVAQFVAEVVAKPRATLPALRQEFAALRALLHWQPMTVPLVSTTGVV